jgi:integrase
MLCVAYETLARRGELVALEVLDIDFHPDGTGQALIRRGKTDAEAQGRLAYLSRETVRWLKLWLERASIEEGAVFRRLVGSPVRIAVGTRVAARPPHKTGRARFRHQMCSSTFDA